MSFRLEALLRMRKNQENLVQRALGEINTRIVHGEDKLKDISKSSKSTQQLMNDRYAQVLDSKTLQLYNNYFNGLEIQTRTEHQNIHEATTQAEGKRQELVESMQKRRTLEFLKEKEIAKERLAAQKKEIAFLDDVASTQWHRREQ